MSQLSEWYQRLRTIAQYGLTYSKDPYDLQRFREVQTVTEELAQALTQEPAELVTEALRLELGPPSPKLDVRAAVFREGCLLLVRETADGLWSLPGGWVDVGDAPAGAAVREVKEESGYDCVARKLIAVIDWNQHSAVPQLFHCYKLLFGCELVGGAPAASLETSECGFFARGALPPLSLPRVSEAMIERAFRHQESPELPTEFD